MMVLRLKAAGQAGNHMLLKTGHFHFGRNRTFSLWLDINGCKGCHAKVIMSYSAKVKMSY